MLSLIIETWIWWSVVIIIATCRGISRTLALGSIRKLQADDYVMLASLCTYTTLIVTINIVANASTNLLPVGFDASTLTAQDKQKREFGSKLVLVVEECQILTVWGVKACILIMYSRLTVGRVENVAIKMLAGYVAFAFVFMEIFYLGVWCRPFHYYWAVPTPNEQCNAATNHLITNAVFNLSSDVILLAIALPMFIRSRLPKQKKIALVCVFGLGIFVILCSILNKYYSFTQPFGNMWTFWYVRESSTALLIANLPFMWTLLRRVFKFKFLGTTTVNDEYTIGPLSQMRKESTVPSNLGIDPESGRKFSDGRYPSLTNTHGKTEAEVYFLTTPSSTTDSWVSRDYASPQTPTRCAVRDSYSDPVPVSPWTPSTVS